MNAALNRRKDSPMSKETSLGYTDTAISGVTTLPFARGLLNIKEDFVVKEEGVAANGEKFISLTNITAPVDQPELARISYRDIPNIYNGMKMEPNFMAPMKSGKTIIFRVSDVISVTDTEDPLYRVDAPISAQLVLRVPDVNATPVHIETIIGRVISLLYDTGVSTDTRLKGLLRGAIAPPEL